MIDSPRRVPNLYDPYRELLYSRGSPPGLGMNNGTSSEIDSALKRLGQHLQKVLQQMRAVQNSQARADVTAARQQTLNQQAMAIEARIHALMMERASQIQQEMRLGGF
jgi:gamma-glutamylcysteine synthetase